MTGLAVLALLVCWVWLLQVMRRKGEVRFWRFQMIADLGWVVICTTAAVIQFRQGQPGDGWFMGALAILYVVFARQSQIRLWRERLIRQHDQQEQSE